MGHPASTDESKSSGTQQFNCDTCQLLSDSKPARPAVSENVCPREECGKQMYGEIKNSSGLREKTREWGTSRGGEHQGDMHKKVDRDAKKKEEKGRRASALGRNRNSKGRETQKQ